MRSCRAQVKDRKYNLTVNTTKSVMVIFLGIECRRNIVCYNVCIKSYHLIAGTINSNEPNDQSFGTSMVDKVASGKPVPETNDTDNGVKSRNTKSYVWDTVVAVCIFHTCMACMHSFLKMYNFVKEREKRDVEMV